LVDLDLVDLEMGRRPVCARLAMGRTRPRLRSAVRSGTRGSMCWTAVLVLYRLGLLGSFTLRALGWRGVIWGGLV
jgi:hypothetical protein